MLATPLLNGDQAIGAIVIYKAEPGAFPARQLALLQNFAAQAVIAIENAQLFDEVQAKTHDLEEALRYQTGSANILNVIASSPTDVQPVLKAIVESACELCDAHDAVVLLKDGNDLCFSAHYGPIPINTERWPIDRSWASGRAVIDRATVHVHDIYAADAGDFHGGRELSRRAGSTAVRSILAAPLLREGESIGTILLRRQEVRPFNDKQIAMLQTFADQAVIALGNVRLFEEVQARTRDLQESLQQQTATADVLKAISRSAFDLQIVLDTLVESATHLCDADHAVLFQCDGDLLRFKSSFGHHTEVHARLRDLFLFREMRIDRGSITGRSALEACVVHVADVLNDPDFTRSDAQKISGFRAALGAPLFRDGKVVGVIFVAKTKPEPFSEKQIELVTTFADQAVIAIENARLFEEVTARTEDLRQSLEYQTATSEVLGIISRSPTDVQPVFEAIAASALRLCGAKWSVVTRYDGAQLHLAALHNLSDPEGVEAIRKIFPRPLSRGGPTDRAILTGTVINLPDVLKDPEYIYQSISTAAGYRSHLAVPTVRDGNAVGAITVAGEHTAAFTERHVSLLRAFADQAVIAIENVRLFDELNDRSEDLRELLQQQTATADALKVISRSAFDLDTVMDTLARSACHLCGANGGALFLRDGDKLVCRGVEAVTPADKEFMKANPVVPLDSDLNMGRAVLTGTIVNIGDVEGDENTSKLRKFQQAFGFRAFLAVPLMREGHGVGVLTLNRPAVGKFPPRQVELVQTFADQAVIAIENTRLFNETKEALARQTATSDVLKVIASSPSNLQPVFDAIAERSKTLIGGHSTTVVRYLDGIVELASFTQVSPEADATLQALFPMRPDTDPQFAPILARRDRIDLSTQRLSFRMLR